MLVANLRVRVLVGARIRKAYLQIRVGHFAVRHNLQILENLHVALVGVHNHIEVLVCAEHLGKHIAKRFLEHTYHCGLVDVLKLFELGKPLHHIGSFFFLGHELYGVCFLFEIYVISHILGVVHSYCLVLILHDRTLHARLLHLFRHGQHKLAGFGVERLQHTA